MESQIKNLRVAFGPETTLSSFDWVGRDIANELTKDYQIGFFQDFDTVPNCDVILIIKFMPSLTFLLQAKKEKKTLIYIPVDFFTHRGLFVKYSSELLLFDCILLHCSKLAPFIDNRTKTQLIDHYLKYSVKVSPRPSHNKKLLWVGRIKYLPSLFTYLSTIKNKMNFILLSDIDNFKENREFLSNEFKNAGLQFNWEETKEFLIINDFKIGKWTPETQKTALNNCYGAFDIKGDTFAFNTKPPTKAQKFIASGIPFAINKDSYSYSYFKKLGFPICAIEDSEYWLSEKYHNLTQEFACNYKNDISLTTVINSYKIAIESDYKQNHFNQLKVFFIHFNKIISSGLFFLFRVKKFILNKFHNQQ